MKRPGKLSQMNDLYFDSMQLHCLLAKVRPDEYCCRIPWTGPKKR